MNDLEKLQVLIPHWIEHNNEHADEFRRWAEKAGDAAPELHAAADVIAQKNKELTVLNSISKILSQSLKAEDIFENIFRKVTEFIRMDGGSVHRTKRTRNPCSYQRIRCSQCWRPSGVEPDRTSHRQERRTHDRYPQTW